MEHDAGIVNILVRHYPAAQAIYRYGSAGTEHERPDSDVDIALLLHPVEAKTVEPVGLGPAYEPLVRLLKRDVDLVNLRTANTVLQHEIIWGRRIYVGDAFAADEFEMLTMSYYQQLNYERAGIIEAGLTDGRFLKS